MNDLNSPKKRKVFALSGSINEAGAEERSSGREGKKQHVGKLSTSEEDAALTSNLTETEADIVDLLLLRFHTKARLRKELISKSILTTEVDKSKGGDFVTKLMVRTRSNMEIKRKVVSMLEEGDFLSQVAQSSAGYCGLQDQWILMDGPWRAKPAILQYQQQVSISGAAHAPTRSKQREVMLQAPTAAAAAAAASSSSSSSSSSLVARGAEQPVRWPIVRFVPNLCVRDCGAGGDCLFKSIAWAMNKKFNTSLTHKDIRSLAAREITEADLPLMNASFFAGDEEDAQAARRYRKNKHIKAFTLEQMRATISRSGMGYQGDSEILGILTRSREMHDTGFLVFTQGGTFYPLMDPPGKKYARYLLLFHMTNQENEKGQVEEVEHFQLAGWMTEDGNVVSIVELHDFPAPLLAQLCAENPKHNICDNVSSFAAE